MKAGDTAYVGPGLYRGEVLVLHDGTPDQRLVFIADATGEHTGDPPGTVMITGAEPVDETIFAPYSAPGVFTAKVPYPVLGVVEMDGLSIATSGPWIQGVSHRQALELEVVAKLPSSLFYDGRAASSTSTRATAISPTTHEIELIRRGNGIAMVEGIMSP